MSRDRGLSAPPVSDDSWRSILAGVERQSRKAIARRLNEAEAARTPVASRPTAPVAVQVAESRPKPAPPEEVSVRWLWWTAVLLGAAAPLAAGVRVRERSWIVGGGVLLLVEILGLVLNGGADGATTPLQDFGTGLFAIGWIAGVAFVAAFRGLYRAKVCAASHLEAREAVHSGRNAERERARVLARTDPAEALRRGVGRPDIPGADHGWVVDVNHAPASVLETLPGVDADLARRIVATRGSVGLVSSVDDLGLMLDLDHRTVERLRATAVAVEI
jgi:hypothetical protein